MERVERIKHLNVRGFWAQGIVSADAIIPMCIASFRPADCLPTTPLGRGPAPVLPAGESPQPGVSAANSWPVCGNSSCRQTQFSRLVASTEPESLRGPGCVTSIRSDWVVYAKRSFGGPEHVLALPRRLHASGCHLQSPPRWFGDGKVTFRWRDSAHKHKKRLARLPVQEFLRRFLLHVLPRGFVRIRHFGFYAHRRRAVLVPVCARLLGVIETAATTQGQKNDSSPDATLWKCPHCQGAMVVVERLTPQEVRLRSPPDPTSCS